MFLQDLTLMCIYQNQCQYLFPQKTSFYYGFINHELGLNNTESGLPKGLNVILEVCTYIKNKY